MPEYIITYEDNSTEIPSIQNAKQPGMSALEALLSFRPKPMQKIIMIVENSGNGAAAAWTIGGSLDFGCVGIDAKL